MQRSKLLRSVGSIWIGWELVSASSALAATIYVDGQLSTSSSSAYDPATRASSGGSDTAYRAVSGALAMATPGTTVVFRAGNYAERLRPVQSGTEQAYVTFKPYGTEAVYFTTSPGMDLSGRSYLIVDGLRVQDTTWLEARDTHHCIVRNCTFLRNPNGGTTGNVRFISSTFNQILNNVIEDGNDNLLLIDSDFNLVEGNTIREARHSVFGIRCGDFNVIRGNVFSNTQQKIGEVYDCGADTSAVANSFNSTSRNLIEDNVFAGTVSYYSTSGGNGIQYAGQHGIVRRNVFYNCNVGIGMQVYGDEALHNVNNRIYHNVFSQNFGAGISLRANTSSNYFLNNVLVGNAGCNADCDAVSPGQVVYRTPAGDTFRFVNNAILYQQPGQEVFEPEFSSGMSVAEFSAANPGTVTGTLEVDPAFLDSAAFDFRLQSSSPLIDAGAFLTRTASAGNGTNLVVEDVTPFYDGWGIAGELGDTLQIEGQTQTAQILKIDSASRSLQLNAPLTWGAGKGVALAFSGAAPDIGAFEATSEPPPALSALQVAGALILRWDAAATGYRLQKTVSLHAPAWTDVAPGTLVDGSLVLTNTFDTPEAYYRLEK